MRKIALCIIILMILTACSNQSSNVESKANTLEKISASFLSEYEMCKEKEYINLDFSDCSAKLSQLDTCSNLNVTIECQQTSNKRLLQGFEEYVTFFFSEYHSENSLFSSSDESVTYNQSEDDGKYAWYPKTDNYVENIENDNIEISSFLYRDIVNSKYLWWNMSNNFPHWINKGEAYSFIKTDNTKISSWIPSDMDNKVISYFNDGVHDDEKYHLVDGDVSIGEAVNYFESEYLSSLPYKVDENYSINVSSIDVYSIKDGLYGYVFNFSTAWNGIPFDSREETFSYQDTSYQYLMSGEALMIRNNDIDTVVDLQFPKVEEAAEPIESICTLESAVNIISSKLTKAVKFEVETIELVYTGNYNDDYTSAYLEPSWKFVAYNPNDTYHYCVYVNAVSGECSYTSYIPLTNSGM